MKDETFLSLSFAATIAYGWLALLALLVAGAVVHDVTVIRLALLACGASYLSQSFATNSLASMPLRQIAIALQFIALGLWLLGLVAL